MELVEMLAIKPQDYLKDGFFAKDGEFHEGINGYYSLAMAYRLRDEKVSPDSLKKIADLLDELAMKQSATVDEDPDQPLDKSAQEALGKILKRKEIVGSAALSEVIAAAKPWINNWKGYAAFAMHIDRILAQLALLTNLPPKDAANVM